MSEQTEWTKSPKKLGLAAGAAAVVATAVLGPNVASGEQGVSRNEYFSTPDLANTFKEPDAPKPTEQLVEYTVGSGEVAESIAEGLGAKDSHKIETWLDAQSKGENNGVYAGDKVVLPASELSWSNMTPVHEDQVAMQTNEAGESVPLVDPADGPLPVEIKE